MTKSLPNPWYLKMRSSTAKDLRAKTPRRVRQTPAALHHPISQCIKRASFLGEPVERPEPRASQVGLPALLLKPPALLAGPPASRLKPQASEQARQPGAQPVSQPERSGVQLAASGAAQPSPRTARRW